MSRDHRSLRAFELADALVIAVYRLTRRFPREELFGLTSQLRRAAVSVAANIVEGCARKSQAEYAHALNVAFGSLREVGYLLDLSGRLELIPASLAREACLRQEEAARVLSGLLRSLERGSTSSSRLKPHSLKPQDSP